LDAVTSQRGATGAESASGWVRASPVARNVPPQANLETRRGAKKQTAGELQTGCQPHTSSVEYRVTDKLLITNSLPRGEYAGGRAQEQAAVARGQTLAQVAPQTVQSGELPEASVPLHTLLVGQQNSNTGTDIVYAGFG
jgi:hypothetical protein